MSTTKTADNSQFPIHRWISLSIRTVMGKILRNVAVAEEVSHTIENTNNLNYIITSTKQRKKRIVTCLCAFTILLNGHCRPLDLLLVSFISGYKWLLSHQYNHNQYYRHYQYLYLNGKNHHHRIKINVRYHNTCFKKLPITGIYVNSLQHKQSYKQSLIKPQHDAKTKTRA